MINHILVTLVDSVLGQGRKTSNGNYAYHCPFCHHHKPKLEINFTENKQGHNPWHCWVCNTRGKTIVGLFKKTEASPEKITEAKSYTRSGYEVEETVVKNQLNLPEEFTPLYPTPTGISAKHALFYLKKRNITIEDIEATKNFVEKNNNIFPVFHVFTPYPGTKFWELYKNNIYFFIFKKHTPAKYLSFGFSGSSSISSSESFVILLSLELLLLTETFLGVFFEHSFGPEDLGLNTTNHLLVSGV